MIGTLAHKAEAEGFEVYMMTPDKDYGQLVTPHVFIYKPKFGAAGFDTLGVEEVKAKFDIDSPLQVIDLLGLMGDQSDNIPGCPGVGEKTAAKLLKEFGSIENLLQNTDKLKGALQKKIVENEEQIKFSRFLATIKTDVPVEFDAQAMVMEQADEEALITLFTELEFRGQLKKLQGITDAPVASRKKSAANSMQPSLFGDENEAIEADKEVIESALSTSFDNITNVEHQYHIVQTEEEIANLISAIKDSKLFCFDSETTSVNALQAELVGLSFALKPHEAYYLPISSNREEALATLAHFKPLFEDATIEKTGQNMKYDMLVLGNYGIEVKGKLFDTMIAHYLLNPELRHGMDYMAETLLDYQTIHIESLIGGRGKSQGSMRDVALEAIAEYAAEDADVTLQLREVLRSKLTEQGLLSLFEDIEMPLVSVLVDMERAGMLIDTEVLRESSRVLSAQLRTIEEQIGAHCGETINISSPKQIGQLLFEQLKIVDKPKKTKTGQYVTDEETLESLRGKHEVIGLILEYRGLKKLLSRIISALMR